MRSLPLLWNTENQQVSILQCAVRGSWQPETHPSWVILKDECVDLRLATETSLPIWRGTVVRWGCCFNLCPCCDLGIPVAIEWTNQKVLKDENSITKNVLCIFWSLIKKIIVDFFFFLLFVWQYNEPFSVLQPAINKFSWAVRWCEMCTSHILSQHCHVDLIFVKLMKSVPCQGVFN